MALTISLEGKVSLVTTVEAAEAWYSRREARCGSEADADVKESSEEIPSR